MTSNPRRTRRALGLLAIVAVSALIGPGVAVGSPSAPDLRVALMGAGGCGTFADSLPVLVTRPDIRPGDVAGDVTVCMKVLGSDGRKPRLQVAELVDLDAACTGDERAVDRTCGGMGQGELAASLLQQTGFGPCSVTLPPINSGLERRLTALRDDALVLASKLRVGEVACTRLQLVYRPAGLAAAIASQSDRVTWRYAFTVG